MRTSRRIRRRSRSRLVIRGTLPLRIAALCAATAFGSLALIRPVQGPTPGDALTVSLGLFAGLVTALTFAIASISARTAWPGINELLTASFGFDWFAVSALSIGAAITSTVWQNGAPELASAAVILSILSGTYGAFAVYATLKSGAGGGLRSLRARLLGDSFLRSSHTDVWRAGTGVPEHDRLVRTALLTGDIPAVRDAVAELAESSELIAKRAPNLDALERVGVAQLSVLARLARGLIGGRLEATAAPLLEEAATALLTTCEAAREASPSGAAARWTCS
jgi:hypothetical protein